MSRSHRSSFNQKTIKGHRHAEAIEREDVEIRTQLEEELQAQREEFDEEVGLSAYDPSDWHEYQSDLYFDGSEDLYATDDLDDDFDDDFIDDFDEEDESKPEPYDMYDYDPEFDY